MFNEHRGECKQFENTETPTTRPSVFSNCLIYILVHIQSLYFSLMFTG